MKFTSIGLLLAIVANVVHDGLAANNGLCRQDGKECGTDADDIWSHHVPIINGCAASCRHNPQCKTAVVKKDKTGQLQCHLRAIRCGADDDKLQPSTHNSHPTTDFYRLTDAELTKNEAGKVTSCPSGRTYYDTPKPIYGDVYCKHEGTICDGESMYPKDWIYSTVDKCKAKCSKIWECGMFNWKSADGSCDIKRAVCTKDQQKKEQGTDVYERVAVGKKCPPKFDENMFCVHRGKTCDMNDSKRIKVVNDIGNPKACKTLCFNTPSCGMTLYVPTMYRCYLFRKRSCNAGTLTSFSAVELQVRKEFKDQPCSAVKIY